MAAVCGIDWAAEFHDVRIADEHGHVLAEQRFAHDEHGIGALIALLVCQRVELVAIERPDGLARRAPVGGRAVRAGDPSQPGRRCP